MNRRAFCIHACGAVSVAAVGGLNQACSKTATSPSSASNLPSVNGSVSGRTITVTIDSSSPLATVGGAALVQTSAGALLAARTAQDTVTAVSAACTHESCVVSGVSGSNYVCPCHGSVFTFSGSVVQGPATRALTTLAAQLSGNTLTVSF